MLKYKSLAVEYVGAKEVVGGLTIYIVLPVTDTVPVL
jgi:hypothetical protein